jgi:hypothetical protein
MAMEVVETLRARGAGGRTVALTIHQPNSLITAKFDDFILLAAGRAVLADAGGAFRGLALRALRAPVAAARAVALLGLVAVKRGRVGKREELVEGRMERSSRRLLSPRHRACLHPAESLPPFARPTGRVHALAPPLSIR